MGRWKSPGIKAAPLARESPHKGATPFENPCPQAGGGPDRRADADGKELASEDIVKAAAEVGISERTVQNAKRNMGGILGARRIGGQWYNFIKKKQPPEPAS